MLKIKTTATQMKNAFHRLMRRLNIAEVSVSLKISQYKLPKLNCKEKIKKQNKTFKKWGRFQNIKQVYN